MWQLSVVLSQATIDGLMHEQGGPAAQSNKILQNDVLLDVDGHSIVGKPLAEIQSMLAGEAHAPVTMTFARLYGSSMNQTSQQVENPSSDRCSAALHRTQRLFVCVCVCVCRSL